MLTSTTVDDVIYAAIETLNAERGPDEQVPLAPSTALFGLDAQLDSLSFVSLIMDVEGSLNLDHDLGISLADDRAMSRPVSPYATVASLRDYILELAAERP
jgi:acyl carrier protein